MDEQFTPEELELAFGFHIVDQILGADGRVAADERRFLERTFPREVMERSRFVGPDGAFTARWQEALGEALLVLPTLPEARRLAIVETFFRAALADDVFELAEEGVMRRAARLLGLGEPQVRALLDRVVTNEVELDSTEG